MTQPNPHYSLALFRDSLIVDFVPLPAGASAEHFSSNLKRAAALRA